MQILTRVGVVLLGVVNSIRTDRSISLTLVLLGTVSTAAAHPVSHTDAWVTVADVVDVRLNVFLDDVVRHQWGAIPEQPTIAAETLNAVIEKHTDTLLTQLLLFDSTGRSLTATVVAEPRWRPRTETVDVVSEASLKLTWRLRFVPGGDVTEIRSLCFLHHFTHNSLPEPGELRLHLRHRASGRRIDVVVPPGRPHTLIMPAVRDAARRSSSDFNVARSRIVIAPTGVVHEFTAPLLLMDRAWPAAADLRGADRHSDVTEADALDEAQANAVRDKIALWMRDNVVLRVNGAAAEIDEMSVELRPASGATAAEGEPAAFSADVPVFAAQVGVRMVCRQTESITSLSLAFAAAPGPFTELTTEVITATHQTSELTPFHEPTDSGSALTFRWRRDSQVGPDLPAGFESTDSDASFSRLNPVTVSQHRPGRRGIGLAVILVLVAGGRALFRRRAARGRATWLSVLIVVVACAICLGAFPDQTMLVDEKATAELTEQLLDRVYRAVMQGDERARVAGLSAVLHDEFVEEVFVSTLASLAAPATDPILISIDSVRVDSVHTDSVPSSPGEIVAATTWRVGGTVCHWGHAHRRALILKGNVTLRESAEGWKISSISQTQPTQFETVVADDAES